MIISKIEKQKKDNQRYSVFVDGEFSFGIYEDSLVKFGLRSGDELDESKIEEIRKYDEFNYGKKAAYTFLGYRQRTKKEIINKLKLKKISQATIDSIIELLESQKYIDDNTYAKNYLDEKLKSKPIGKRLAKLKLSEKGIDKETIDKTVEENYTEEKEEELASLLLEKYRKKLLGREKPEAEIKNKCYRYLISRGFGFDTIKKVIDT